MTTFGGNVLVSGGVLIARALGLTPPSTRSATCTVAGKTITVNGGATLIHGNNDLYFNGAAA